MSVTFTNLLGWFVLIYLAASPVLLVVALINLYLARTEIACLKEDVERIDADIDVLWGPEDPDGGDEDDEVEPSNVVAFGRKSA